MSGLILNVGAEVSCPHGGRVSPLTVNTRVLLGGTPALVVTDGFPIIGCPFEVPMPGGATPRPCVEVVWNAPAARVLVDGRPVLVASSTGQCLSAEHYPQGPPVQSRLQPRVTAV